MASKFEPNTLFVGRYLIEGYLGSGGMSTVYLALDGETKQKVALKVLEFGDGDKAKRLKRFKQEIEIIDGINSPNVVELVDYCSDEEPYFYAMEYFEGRSLEEIASNTISLKRVVHIAINVIRGLQHIHDYGITHRDLKPGNIIVNDNNEVKIIDFGVAKAYKSSVTADGEMVGSFDYMAPEVWKGTYVTYRADVYSLGIILYLLTTGRLPFDSTNMSNLMYQHLEGHIVFPSELNKAMPYWLGELILQMLEIEPGMRPNLAAIKNTIIDNSGLTEYRDEENLDSSAIKISNRNVTATQSYLNEISNLDSLEEEKPPGFVAAIGTSKDRERLNFSWLNLSVGFILAGVFVWCFANFYSDFQTALATDALKEIITESKNKLRFFFINVITLSVFMSLAPLLLVFATESRAKVFSKLFIIPYVYSLLVCAFCYLLSMVTIGGLPQQNLSLILNKFNLIFTHTAQTFMEVVLLVPVPTVQLVEDPGTVIGFLFNYNIFFYIILLIYLYSILLFNRDNLKIKKIIPNPHTYLIFLVFLLYMFEYFIYLVLKSHDFDLSGTQQIRFGIYQVKLINFNIICSVVNWLAVLGYLLFSPRIRVKTNDLRTAESESD